MEQLYAPWRAAYFGTRSSGCVFCTISEDASLDSENQVLYRDDFCFVVMNLYPYTPGHIMVIPHQHVDSLEALEPPVWQHMALLGQKGVRLLNDQLGAHGVNLGMNLGAAAGAGIAEHIHLHLVPRFERDTNFITTIGQVRVGGISFEEIFTRLRKVSDDYFA